MESMMSSSIVENINDLKRKVWNRLRVQKVCQGDANTPVNMDYISNPFEIGGIDGARRNWDIVNDSKVIFHAYWYGKVSRLQVASINSLFATQESYDYVLWLWLDEDTFDQNGEDNEWMKSIYNNPCIVIKRYNPKKYVMKDSVLSKSMYLFDNSKKLAMRADGLRIWALHQYGGFYFDLDVMFLRDMGKLILGPEFVYAWEKQVYANSAIIYLRKGSYLNEYIARKVNRVHSTQPWDVFKYDDPGMKPLRLYSTSLFDPIWNDDSEEYYIHNFDEFFKKRLSDFNCEKVFPYSYAYHWHNNWSVEIEEGSLFARLESLHAGKLGI